VCSAICSSAQEVDCSSRPDQSRVTFYVTAVRCRAGLGRRVQRLVRRWEVDLVDNVCTVCNLLCVDTAIPDQNRKNVGMHRCTQYISTTCLTTSIHTVPPYDQVRVKSSQSRSSDHPSNLDQSIPHTLIHSLTKGPRARACRLQVIVFCMFFLLVVALLCPPSGDRYTGTFSGHTGSSLSLLICLLRGPVLSCKANTACLCLLDKVDPHTFGL